MLPLNNRHLPRGLQLLIFLIIPLCVFPGRKLPVQRNGYALHWVRIIVIHRRCVRSAFERMQICREQLAVKAAFFHLLLAVERVRVKGKLLFAALNVVLKHLSCACAVPLGPFAPVVVYIQAVQSLANAVVQLNAAASYCEGIHRLRLAKGVEHGACLLLAMRHVRIEGGKPFRKLLPLRFA